MSGAERGLFLSSKGESPVGDSQNMPITPEISRRELWIRPFRLPHHVEASLNGNQQEILTLLTSVARGVAYLYATQEGKDERANFYPPKVAKKLIEEAARTDPQILSPYTIVRTDNGGLKPIPMHMADEDLIKKLSIVDLLKRAAKIASKGSRKDKKFKEYLEALAGAFKTGDWEKSERLWLTRDGEPIIDIFAKPADTYTDRLMGVKYAWEAWVGILNEPETSDAQWFVDALLDCRQKETGLPIPRVRIRIDETVVQSGQAAKQYFTGESMPCDPKLREDCGSKLIIFKPAFEDNLRSEWLPTFRTIIDPARRKGISDSLIETVFQRSYIAHEIGHIEPTPDIERRLGIYAPIVEELFCNLVAVSDYGQIPGITPRERDLAIAVLFVDGLHDYKHFDVTQQRFEYYVASSTILSYCLEKGNIRKENGHLTWEYPSLVFKDILELCDETKKLLQERSRKEAEDFFKRHFDPDVYKELVESVSRNRIPSFLQRDEPPV